MELKPGYKQTEVGVIPEDWEVCPVRQKGEVITGKALAVNAPGPQRPYLRTKNVFDGRIDIGDVLKMPMTDEQFAQFRIRNGDVLLNEGQSLELVGRCAIYQDEYPEPCAIQNALLRFRARAGVSDKFSSYLFRYCQHTGVFARIALQTTSVAHLGGVRFERLLLAWPTEPEQRAIATALSDVDALLGALDRLITKKRDLKQAAMQQLLTGQTRLPGFHGEWEVKTVRDLGTIQTGPFGTLLKAEEYSGTDGVPLISVGEVGAGRFKISDQTPRVPNRVVRRLPQYVLRAGDIVFGRKGAVDRSALVTEAEDGWFLGSDGIRLRPHEQCHPRYLAWQFQRYDVQTWLLQNAIGTTMASLNQVILNRVQIPYAPFPEQFAIAAVLTDMDAELAALEQRLAKTRALKQGMMQELLTGRTRLV